MGQKNYLGPPCTYEDDNEKSKAIPLPKLTFSNVENLTIFVPSNHADCDVTVLRGLIFIGERYGEVTDMSSFKRVSGKVGEGE